MFNFIQKNTPASPAGCERCSALEDQLLRTEQTAFENLQKLSDAHEAMREQCQQTMDQNKSLGGKISQLEQQLAETEQQVKQLKDQLSSWQFRQKATISQLRELHDTLQESP